jgi:hypothetical protein
VVVIADLKEAGHGLDEIGSGRRHEFWFSLKFLDRLYRRPGECVSFLRRTRNGMEEY